MQIESQIQINELVKVYWQQLFRVEAAIREKRPEKQNQVML